MKKKKPKKIRTSKQPKLKFPPRRCIDAQRLTRNTIRIFTWNFRTNTRSFDVRNRHAFSVLIFRKENRKKSSETSGTRAIVLRSRGTCFHRDGSLRTEWLNGRVVCSEFELFFARKFYEVCAFLRRLCVSSSRVLIVFE